MPPGDNINDASLFFGNINYVKTYRNKWNEKQKSLISYETKKKSFIKMRKSHLGKKSLIPITRLESASVWSALNQTALQRARSSPLD